MTQKGKLRYVEVKARPRIELVASFQGDDPNAICEALYSAAQHETDWRWSQVQCLNMLRHESMLVRSAALIALSEIALYRGNLDLDIVIPEMKRLCSDPALAPFVEDGLDNIRASKIGNKLRKK